MAKIVQHSITPPLDPETNLNVRNSLNYYVVLPQGYKETEPRGFVFTITGYGSTADDEYYKNKLNTYIADKYGFIVAGVRYHNDARTTPQLKVNLDGLTAFYQLPKNYFTSNVNIIEKLHDLLISRKLFRIDPQCAVQADAFHKYSSFGFMPAIDHLYVLHDILGKYAIDKRFISILGTSYGGYIASVMGKYAPYTFSLIINNSGFSVAQLAEILGSKMGVASGSFVKYSRGIRHEVSFAASTIWELDEMSPFYFSDAHKKIRNLLLENHRVASQTVYCHFHSVRDIIAPVKYKDMECEILKKYNYVYYKKIESEKDIDGELFKDMNHGMNASLRNLFDYSYRRYLESKITKDPETDFDLESMYGFECSDKEYIFRYSDQGVKVEIKDLTEIPDSKITFLSQ